MKSWIRGLVILASLGASLAWAGPVYTLAVVPQFTTVDIGLRWTPLLDRIKKETGITLQIRSTADIPAFETEFLAGIPDFVFLNPYHMVMAARAQDYRPLARSSQALSGILVVRKDSNIENLKGLDGATVAFPAPNAFGASLYMRALLTEQYGISFTTSYVGTHQNVYRHVLFGDAQGGGGVLSTLEREPEGIRNQLRVIFQTPDTASHPLAVHPRVARHVADQVYRALQHMATDKEGRELLARVELDGAIAAEYSRDYAPLEKLKLERYVVTKSK